MSFFNSTAARQFHTKIRTIYRIGPHNSAAVISVLVGCLLNPNLRASRANLTIINRTFHLIAVKNSSIKGIQNLDGKVSYTLINPIWVPGLIDGSRSSRRLNNN
jgi:hypothetical protein